MIGSAGTSTVETMLSSKEILICAGSGGVGKTTTAAAAAAMAAVELGGSVLVITVDPARRLASAMGLERFGNTETRVPDEAFRSAGVEPRGELWAVMLDTRQSWDDLIRRHAPDAETREAILANPIYQNIAGRFVQSHDYIAMERLYELHASGRYDLIVVDTPPSRNAVDFLEAPERMADFFASRLLRWLIAPARSRMLNLASKPFYTVADRILGTQFLSDIAEFFILFQTMHEGFVERADAVRRVLGEDRTTFWVVSTLEAAPLAEARWFIRELEAAGHDLGAVVLNKVLPVGLRRRGGVKAANTLVAEAESLGVALADDLDVEAAAARDLLVELAENYLRLRVVATREAELAASLGGVAGRVASVPHRDGDVADLEGLLWIGRQLWRSGGGAKG